MPKFFNTRKATMSTLQKQNLYQQYKKAVLKFEMPGPLASYSEFISIPNFDVMVDMKCLDCHHSLLVNFAIYADFMQREDAPFPVDQCPKCAKLQFVPLDVYKKLID